MRTGRRAGAPSPVEVSLASTIVLAFIGTLYRSYLQGYAVQPFIYDTFDTFMDWFNTAFWAWNPHGAYRTWGTVYSPLSFVFLRLVTIHSCYLGEPSVARDCDWMGRLAIYATYAMAVVSVGRLYWKHDSSTAPYRTIAVAFGLPLLFALERGNLIMITLVFVLLGFSPHVRSGRLKWLAIGVAINFKIYLISGLAAIFIKRRWSALEGSLFAFLIVYAITWTVIGIGSPSELVANIRDFADLAKTNTWEDAYFPSTLGSLHRLIANGVGGGAPGTMRYLGSSWTERLEVGIPMLVRLTEMLSAAALVAAWRRPAGVPVFRLAAICIGLAITNSEAGGYTHVLVVALVFLERWSGPLRKIALTSAYLLSMPSDIVVSDAVALYQYSWWVDGEVFSHYGIAVGNIARPLLMLVVLCALSLITLRDTTRRPSIMLALTP